MSAPATTTQLAILEALATYRLLTAKQLFDVGVCKHPRHVHTALSELCPKRKVAPPSPHQKRRDLPIDYLHFGNLKGRGSRADVWYLTRRAPICSPKSAAIRRPSATDRIEPYDNEYKHRCDTVDCHIALRLWRSATGLRRLVHTYFGRGDERYRRAWNTGGPQESGDRSGCGFPADQA